MCSSRKYPYPHHRGNLKFLERGVRERTKLQSLYGRKMEVPEDRGVHLRILSMVGVGIFSETTQL